MKTLIKIVKVVTVMKKPVRRVLKHFTFVPPAKIVFIYRYKEEYAYLVMKVAVNANHLIQI